MDNKTKQLGMPHGTATNRLRKMILFDLAKRCELDICYRCGQLIEVIEDFTIDHKEPWLHNNVDLFWDLDNIAFSHKGCNSACSRTAGQPLNKPSPYRKIGLEGTAWCFRCQDFLSIEKFNKDKTRWHGLDNQCKKCRKLYK